MFFCLTGISIESSAEKCCKENTVPQVCLGLCKNLNSNSGNRFGKYDIFGISNLGRCSKHMEAVEKCRGKGMNSK